MIEKRVTKFPQELLSREYRKGRIRINNPTSTGLSDDKRSLRVVGYSPLCTPLTQRHGRPLTTQEPWSVSALLNTHWWGLWTSKVWPRPRVCYRRSNTPCTKANLNASLPTVVLGMKQETDLFEQSSISICNHTTVCCDRINSHKQSSYVGLAASLPVHTCNLQGTHKMVSWRQ